MVAALGPGGALRRSAGRFLGAAARRFGSAAFPRLWRLRRRFAAFLDRLPRGRRPLRHARNGGVGGRIAGRERLVERLVDALLLVAGTLVGVAPAGMLLTAHSVVLLRHLWPPLPG